MLQSFYGFKIGQIVLFNNGIYSEPSKGRTKIIDEKSPCEVHKVTKTTITVRDTYTGKTHMLRMIPSRMVILNSDMAKILYGN